MKITLAVVAALVSAGAGTAYAAPFALTSTSFKNGGNIEQKNAGNIMGCTGEGKSPALEWKNPPAGTKSYTVTAIAGNNLIDVKRSPRPRSCQ